MIVCAHCHSVSERLASPCPCGSLFFHMIQNWTPRPALKLTDLDLAPGREAGERLVTLDVAQYLDDWFDKE